MRFQASFSPAKAHFSIKQRALKTLKTKQKHLDLKLALWHVPTVRALGSH